MVMPSLLGQEKGMIFILKEKNGIEYFYKVMLFIDDFYFFRFSFSFFRSFVVTWMNKIALNKKI